MKSVNPVYTLDFSDNYLFVRLAFTAIVGIAIAGLLTLFMHVLIEFSQQELVESSKANFLDFVRIKREESSQRKKPKPQRPKSEQAPAPPTPQADQQNMSDAGLQVSVPVATTNLAVDIGGIGIGTGDGEYLPIVKVAPAYPVKAALIGTEGTCMVEYTVTSTGATKNVRIVRERCPKVFAKASIAAARKFKYKPRIIDGEAIEVPHVRNRFDFTLEQEVSQ
jgi:protein TonB